MRTDAYAPAARAGDIIVDGQAIEGPSLDRAVIFQSHALLPWRTVLGNVAYAVSSKWRRRSHVEVNGQCVRNERVAACTIAGG
jgi:nitrate/nitrite transport system ATP-binding protein